MHPTFRSLILLAALPAVAVAQREAPAPDTVRAGRYDLGRMWTFENPPAEYFSRTYGFTADSAWFARARMAALRIPGCSAAFVSPHGLIVTNHHCARGSISAVARRGETLLDSGFVARSLEEERRIPGYYADQLIAALDVSDEVNAAVDAAQGDQARAEARRAAAAPIQERLRRQYAGPGDSVWVQVVALYSGGRTSAYVFRRYTDIRLVAAAELQLGFFGGDPDNFTFPRYALDFAVLRAWGADGQPMAGEHFFRWGGGEAGVRAGDVVFVIGNPGQTSRLTTISQLEYQRDVSVAVQAAFLRTRLDAMRAYRAAEPEEAERIDIRNRMFGLSNSLKGTDGRLEALRDPSVIARRAASERALRDSIRARPALRQRYGRLFDQVAALQREKARHAVPARAFTNLLSPTAGSSVLRRAWWASRAALGPADSAALFREQAGRVGAWPQGLERRFLALQLADIARAYGEVDPLTRAVLGGESPEAAAERIVGSTALRDSAGARRAAAGELADDPAMRLVAVILPRALELQREMARLTLAENALAADIGRARYEVFGPAIPPDGSSSPRIADGVVQGYEYNGTWAAPFTTFYGMYDRFRANGPGSDWDLPYRWRTPPAGLDLGTSLNFVSTADSYGGNSGSPAVTRDLRLVGLNFDRNINALVRDYIFLPERGRNVMVDARAIQAALDHVYDADRVVQELLTGRLFRTEQEADAAAAAR